MRALKTLEKSVTTVAFFIKEGKNYNPHLSYEEEYQQCRDSAIQRFEYCVDFFWKFLKKYLETKHVVPDIKVPGEVIRTCYTTGLMSEHEAEQFLEMIKERNKTSHLYLEELAEHLITKIPNYCDLMQKVAQRLT